MLITLIIITIKGKLSIALLANLKERGKIFVARGIHCSILYFFCPTSASILRRIHVYIHISDCVDIVFE